jgi:hypothetical protein
MWSKACWRRMRYSAALAAEEMEALMANWQDELESLLASFGVALEAPALDQLRAEDSLNRYLLAQPEQSEPPVEHGVEVIAVQSEVEATVRQVVSLVRSGSIDSALREDVAFVLRALTRPDATTVEMRTRECAVSSHTLLTLVSCSWSLSGDSRQMSSSLR